MVEHQAHAWVQQAIRWDSDELPAYIRVGVLSCGDEAGAVLHESLGDPDVVSGPAGDHVLGLLAELRYEPAILCIVDLLEEEPFWDAPSEAIAAFGPAAVPVLLEVLSRNPTELMEPLSICAAGTTDPAVRHALASYLWEAPALAAVALSRFGDPSAIPALLSRLATVTIDRQQLFAGQEILEIVHAVEALGGDAGALGRHRMAEVQLARQPHAERISRMHDGLQDAMLAAS